jgi:alpha-L-rhamnosidase
LRCEYRVNPLGIDELQPGLGWIVESSERGQRQTAYQILVASNVERLGKNRGNLWDSGRVASGETTGVVYGGKALRSQQQCFWKVKVWDKDGKASGWSESARWSMGLLKPGDWKAQYISFRDKTPLHRSKEPLFLPPARQYRKEFAAAREVRRATIHATALGVYELHLNGQRVGDAYFAPGWSDYHRRAYYNTYDVTTLVKPGANALGAWVADGWYSGYVGFGLLTGRASGW